MCAGPERLKWVLATMFPLVYFRFISNQNIIYGRYLLPLVPFLSHPGRGGGGVDGRLDAAIATVAADSATRVTIR